MDGGFFAGLRASALFVASALRQSLATLGLRRGRFCWGHVPPGVVATFGGDGLWVARSLGGFRSPLEQETIGFGKTKGEDPCLPMKGRLFFGTIWP